MVPRPLFSRVGCNIDQQGSAREVRFGSLADLLLDITPMAASGGKADLQVPDFSGAIANP